MRSASIFNLVGLLSIVMIHGVLWCGSVFMVLIIMPHNQVVLFCFVGWAVAIILIFYLFVFISCPIHAHLNTTVLC